MDSKPKVFVIVDDWLCDPAHQIFFKPVVMDAMKKETEGKSNKTDTKPTPYLPFPELTRLKFQLGEMLDEYIPPKTMMPYPPWLSTLTRIANIHRELTEEIEDLRKRNTHLRSKLEEPEHGGAYVECRACQNKDLSVSYLEKALAKLRRDYNDCNRAAAEYIQVLEDKNLMLEAKLEEKEKKKSQLFQLQ